MWGVVRAWAGEAGLDTAPGSRLWRIGPAGLARLRRHALRPAAETAAAIYNVHRDPKKSPDPFTAADVMPAVFLTAADLAASRAVAADRDAKLAAERARIARVRAARAARETP